MSRLILIKHAPPEVNPTISSEQWRLGEKGRRLCQPLAERVRPFAPTRVFTSPEPKAIETGEELAQRLGIKTESRQGLAEHDRRDVPHMRSGEFISMIELLFRRPRERVLGNESAQEALERFERAIGSVAAEHPDESVAVITHGTVLALFLARHNPDRRGFDLWRQLGLPSFVVVNTPDFKIDQMVEKVE